LLHIQEVKEPFRMGRETLILIPLMTWRRNRSCSSTSASFSLWISRGATCSMTVTKDKVILKFGRGYRNKGQYFTFNICFFKVQKCHRIRDLYECQKSWEILIKKKPYSRGGRGIDIVCNHTWDIILRSNSVHLTKRKAKHACSSNYNFSPLWLSHPYNMQVSRKLCYFQVSNVNIKKGKLNRHSLLGFTREMYTAYKFWIHFIASNWPKSQEKTIKDVMNPNQCMISYAIFSTAL